jgi:hypothetical protein
MVQFIYKFKIILNSVQMSLGRAGASRSVCAANDNSFHNNTK